MSEAYIDKKGIWHATGILSGQNLLINSDFHNRSTQGTWDTSLNGTLVAANWGGYNGGVSNPTTGYHAHLYLLNNEYVYRYVDTNGRWLGVSQGGLQSKLKANTAYTFTVNQMRPTGSTTYLWGGLYYYATGATSASFGIGQFSGASETKYDQWTKLVYHFTTPSNIDLTKGVSWYIYGHHSGGGTVYMRHPKIEQSSTFTPWGLNTSEDYDLLTHGFVEEPYKEAHIHNKEYIEANQFYEI